LFAIHTNKQGSGMHVMFPSTAANLLHSAFALLRAFNGEL
jgi:hypothetical protein